jgi:hypothetical protein
MAGEGLAVDGGAEHDAGLFLQADEGLAPSWSLRCKPRAGDDDEASAVCQACQSRADMPERGVGRTASYTHHHREGRVHDHDAGTDGWCQMVVDLRGINARDGCCREEMA